MKDRMFYFLLGFMSMGFIAMSVISYYPTLETEEACGKCGSKAWYFQLAEGDK
tara:strand:- start:115 stop:273 length:159 start_codon:yes stop_codon:yes gene_type:complete